MDTAHILQLVQVCFQALGSTGIFCGLLYTAVQFKRYRQSQHFANFSKLVELQMHLREMRVSDPTLAEVYKHDVTYVAKLSDPEEIDRAIRQYFFNLMQLSVFEIVWFGYRNEQIPKDYFLSWESRVRQIAAEPSFRQMWETRSMKILHDDFQSYIDKLVATTPARE